MCGEGSQNIKASRLIVNTNQSQGNMTVASRSWNNQQLPLVAWSDGDQRMKRISLLRKFLSATSDGHFPVIHFLLLLIYICSTAQSIS